MLYAVVVYIFSQPIGFGLGLGTLTYILSVALTLGIIGVFWRSGKVQKENLVPDSDLLNDHLILDNVATDYAG